MSEADAASPANLEDERDELKFELTILQGRLKHEFDFSMMLGPLLADTAPATIEGNARLKRHVHRMKAQLETLDIPDRNKPTTPSPAPPPAARAGKRVALEPAVPPPPPRACSRPRTKRPRIADPLIKAENGEILPRVGDFRVPVFAVMLPKTIDETAAAARWAFTLMRDRLGEALKAPNIARWLLDNWETVLRGEQPPCVKGRFRNYITGCYLSPSNLLRAAKEDSINLIEIARGRGTRPPTEHGHVYQENFAGGRSGHSGGRAGAVGRGA